MTSSAPNHERAPGDRTTSSSVAPHVEATMRAALWLGPLVMVPFAALHLIMGVWQLAVMVGVLALIFVLLLVAGLRVGPRPWIRWAFLASCGATVVGTVHFIGGVTAISGAWYFILPLVAFLLFDRRGFVRATVAFVPLVVGALAYDRLAGPPVNLVPAEWQGVFDGFTFLVFLLAGVSLVVVALLKSERARIQLAELNRRLAVENQTRREAERQALDAAAARARFMATMSHEIRTPLHGLIGQTELVLSRPMDAKARRWAEGALRSGRHLMEVINDVLDVSKLEAGEVDLEAVPVDMAQLLEDCADTMRVPAQERGNRLQVDLPPGGLRVLGDPVRLRQIVLNLASNAVRFTTGGEVVLRAGRIGGDVLVEVQDDGSGIHPDEVPRLFRPFQQGDSSTTRRHGGTGLGLSIVQGLVDAMGGRIRVDTAPGRGTTVCVRIPLDAAGVSAPREDGHADRPTRLQGSVLVVDDNEVNRLVAEATLDQLGLEVAVVDSGEAAIERVSKERFDLVLMDCRMPDMDGYDAALRIRSLLGDRAPVILAFSASVMEADRQRALSVGMAGFVHKPLAAGELQAALRPWLSKAV